jgi:anaerobic ribonucleoside-triphosphate reductase activating protein
MNYHNITTEDLLNGDGLRTVLWVAGCSHHCPFCQNPETHDPDGGIPFDNDAYKELIEDLGKPYISGLTLSGGDPLFTGNRETLTELVKDIKEQFPTKTIWCYTGFLYEEVADLEIMNYIDVLVDGKFIQALNDNTLHWVGSSNQRIIDVKKTKLIGNICLHC